MKSATALNPFGNFFGSAIWRPEVEGEGTGKPEGLRVEGLWCEGLGLRFEGLR